jgi:hypothetical protein
MTHSQIRSHRLILVIMFVLISLCVLAVAKNDDSGSPRKPQNARQSAPPPDPAAEGEKRFEINCGRCHKAPDNIPPRISKTILQHMRTRAMLTQEDEQYILKYIAP